MNTLPLPFSNAPLDFTEAIECSFHQLAAVIRRARLNGFEPIRMTVAAGKYLVTFQRQTATRDHFTTLKNNQSFIIL